MKKMLWMVLCLLLIPGISVCAFAESGPDEYRSGDYKDILLKNGAAEITDYFGFDGELAIPAELDGHAVTTIGDDAFYRCDSPTVGCASCSKEYAKEHNILLRLPGLTRLAQRLTFPHRRTISHRPPFFQPSVPCR